MLLGASFQLVFNNHILINTSTLYNAVSVLACAKLCRFPCSSFFFNRTLHQCVLANRLYEDTHPDIKYEMGWKYYSFTGDADECTANSDNCHADATCTNTVGSFTCACNSGYNGDGVTCTEIPPNYTLMTTENMILKVESVTKLNYTDATAACAVDGAHLFHLDSTAEINAWKQVHMAEYATLVFEFWLGLSDKDYAVNDFRWTDGTPYTGDNWVPGEPSNNNGLDDCAMISPAHNYKWRDVWCSDLLNYVCEIDQTV